jgi:hypothetical protein
MHIDTRNPGQDISVHSIIIHCYHYCPSLLSVIIIIIIIIVIIIAFIDIV